MDAGPSGEEGALGLDRFVHPQILETGGDPLRRARVLIGILIALALISPIAIINHVANGKLPLVLAPVTLLVSVAGLLFAVRRGVSATPLGILLCGIATAVITIAGSKMGGLASPALLALQVIPLVAVVICGARVGWLFGPVWTLLYVMIGVSGALARHSEARERLVPLWVVLALLNGGWSILFFRMHQTGSALIVVACIVVLFVRHRMQRRLRVDPRVVDVDAHVVGLQFGDQVGIKSVANFRPRQRDHGHAVTAALEGEGLEFGTHGILDYIRKTENRDAGMGAFNVAESASPTTDRVSVGSMTPSSQRRAEL